MRFFKLSLPPLCLVLLYWGCQKSDTSANHAPVSLNTRPTTTTINVPENVVTQSIATDSLITNFQQLAVLLQSSAAKTETDGANVLPPPAAAVTIYEGYTKTYDCTSNEWTYVFMWSIAPLGVTENLSGSGSLTVGTTTVSAPFTIVGTQAPTVGPPPTGAKFYIHYTVSIANDNNYCDNTNMTEMISYSYTMPSILPRQPTITKSGAASNTENATPNVYQTYSDLVEGSSANGKGTFTLDVTPGVTVCGPCHAAIGFSPTVTFYYRLEGSGTWQSYSQAGTDLNEFFITLPQAGTYDYYTQEYSAPGVLSGNLGSGSVTVQ